ncbi:MAG: hypothetical protein J7L54_00650 [Elusimicrobia bacterium]|nr:hypothetical protein [Elusimicrobiota bacterium]
MKTYEITIKPISGFATPLMGDTIFGHFCWQFDGIEKLLSDYDKNPFAIFSSACLTKKRNGERIYFLKKPSLPEKFLFEFESEEEREEREEKIKYRKERKKRQFFPVSKSAPLNSLKDKNWKNDKKFYIELEFAKNFSQWHNRINRITGTTGEGEFAPFSVKQIVYKDEFELVIFVGIDERRISKNEVEEAFKNIGKTGFGKDASTGLGRFDVCGINEIDLFSLGAKKFDAVYTLSPFVPEKEYKNIFFTPFTRFGRHGSFLAISKNPFKAPVIMADEGAVVVMDDREISERKFVGSAVKGISKVQPDAVCQGYSLFIPVRIE